MSRWYEHEIASRDGDDWYLLAAHADDGEDEPGLDYTNIRAVGGPFRSRDEAVEVMCRALGNPGSINAEVTGSETGPMFDFVKKVCDEKRLDGRVATVSSRTFHQDYRDFFTERLRDAPDESPSP